MATLQKCSRTIVIYICYNPCRLNLYWSVLILTVSLYVPQGLITVRIKIAKQRREYEAF